MQFSARVSLPSSLHAFFSQVSSTSLHVAYREGLRAGSVVRASAEVSRSMGTKRLAASVDVELSVDEGGDTQNDDGGAYPLKQRRQQLQKCVSVAPSETIVALPNGCSLQLPPGTSAPFADNLIGGVVTSLSIGPLLACALHNIRVSIKDFQLPDANAAMAPASLRVAVSQAVSNALHRARHLGDAQLSDLVLLEPVMRVVVTAPQSVIGAVVSDIGNRRRGKILEVASSDNDFCSDNAGFESQVVAEIPVAQLIGYASSLRSMTGGSATFSATFSKYDTVPDDDACRIFGQ
jgi:translation elongation factor EF-G